MNKEERIEYLRQCEREAANILVDIAKSYRFHFTLVIYDVYNEPGLTKIWHTFKPTEEMKDFLKECYCRGVDTSALGIGNEFTDWDDKEQIERISELRNKKDFSEKVDKRLREMDSHKIKNKRKSLLKRFLRWLIA